MQLREAVTRKGGSRIISLTSRDNVAAEAHYHKTRYGAYTVKRKDQEKQQDDEKATADPDPYQTAEEEAYAMLVKYIKDELISIRTLFLFLL